MRDQLWTACLLGALFGVIAGVACSKTPPPFPAKEDCLGACERGLSLGCEAAGPTPLGSECISWACKTPAMTSARAACMSHAADCAAWSECR